MEICRKFDKDGNGYLSKDEIREAVGDSLSKKEIDDLFAKADSNNDGKVDYEGEQVLLLSYVIFIIFTEFFKTAFAK